MSTGLVEKVAELESMIILLKSQVESLTESLRIAKGALGEVDLHNRDEMIRNVRALKSRIETLEERPEPKIEFLDVIPENHDHPALDVLRSNWWDAARAAHQIAREKHYRTGFMVGESPNGRICQIACLK